MRPNEELYLLLKSKYPVICFETIDETYTLKQLKAVVSKMDFDSYQWSLTEGLRKGDRKSSYYQTEEPIKMLKTVQHMLSPAEQNSSKSSVFILMDFDRYLEDALTLRLFKDITNTVKGTPDTLVIITNRYKLPDDIKADSAHFVGGYPAENEIKEIIWETARELQRTNKNISFSLSKDEAGKILTALKGLSVQQIRNVINQCLLADNTLHLKDLSIIELYKKKVFDQEGLLEFYLTEDKSSIAGFNNLKRWLTERKGSFSHENNSYSLPTPKGVLLMGVQGCGKSLAVKIIAREFSLPLYSLDLTKLYSKYIGETEQNLRKALNIVEKLCPVCLWIDEIEKGFAGSRGDADSGVSRRILGTFLTWMQERKATCFVAATANDVHQLPPEFLRKGRFDEVFFVDLPDDEPRKRLLEIHLGKRNLNPEEFDLNNIVEKSSGFSGAEIEQAVISALYRASTEKETISTGHIIEQIEGTRPLSVLKQEEISALRSWASERTIHA